MTKWDFPKQQKRKIYEHFGSFITNVSYQGFTHHTHVPIQHITWNIKKDYAQNIEFNFNWSSVN